MTIYCVQIQIPRSDRTEFLEWLRPHVAEMLELPCFSDARVFEACVHDDPTVTLEARYTLCPGYSFSDYKKHFASKMRGQLPEHLKRNARFQRSLIEPEVVE